MEENAVKKPENAHIYDRAWLKKYRLEMVRPEGKPGIMSQREVADAIGVHLVTYCCWESGTKTPGLKPALALAKLLGFDVFEFDREIAVA